MRTLLVFLAVFLVAASPAEARKSKVRKAADASQAMSRKFSAENDNIISLNAAGFLYGYAGLGYERAMGDDNSLSADLMYRSVGGSGYNFTAIGLAPGYRWYLGNHGHLSGWYAGPKVYLLSFSFSYDTVVVSGFTTSRKAMTYSTMLYGAGGTGGYQWVFPNDLSASVGLEAMFLAGSLDLGAGSPSVGVGGVGTGLVGSVGYNF
jgi:hypothetical protein